MNATTKSSRSKKSIAKLYFEEVAANWQLWTLVGLVGLSILGAVLLTKRSLLKQSEIPTWPTTTAQVVKAQVTQANNLEPMLVQLELEYQVNGKSYHSSYQRSWIPSSSQNNPKDLRQGDRIPIRYQPSNPQMVSLHPHGP